MHNTVNEQTGMLGSVEGVHIRCASVLRRTESPCSPEEVCKYYMRT